VFKAPYGAAFTFAPAQPGHPHDIWLLYDSANDEKMFEWLRETLRTNEDYLRQMVEATKNLEPPPPQNVTSPPQSVLAAIKAMPTTHSSGHDWGGPYKIGSVCRRCGQTADGLETACTKAAWAPATGMQVIDKRTKEVWEIEGGEGNRWLMKDGPVLTLAQMEPVPEKKTDS
jgi:hypothetical protein